MPNSNWTVRLCKLALALAGCAGSFALPGQMALGLRTAIAESPAGPLSGDIFNLLTKQATLEIPERFSKVLQMAPNIKRVDGFDPNIISVTALAPNQLRLQAQSQGVTTLVVTDETDKVYTVEVLVTGDARLLQAVLRREFPETFVSATKLRDAVLLRGWVTEPQQIRQIVEIAELYFPSVLNQMVVGGPQQVQLTCKVIEVQRSKIRQLGLNFAVLTQSAAFSSTPGAIAPLGAFSLPFGGAATGAAGINAARDATMSLGIIGSNAAFQGLLLALRTEGLLKIQSEPVLLTRSGEPASIVSGGEFPIPVPGGLGIVTIQWRQFGVRLESVPLVLSPRRLKQTLIAEVSEKDLTSSVQLGGTTVPGLTRRTVETQVEMDFGETLAIAGLISTRRTAQTFKTPVLGELPVIGAAFRRVEYNESEVENLVLITPTFVDAADPSQMPRVGPGMSTDVPTDRELFGQGVLEVPNSGERCENCENGDGYQAGAVGAYAPPGATGYSPARPVPTADPIGPPGLIMPDGVPPVPSSPPPAPGTGPTSLKKSKPRANEVAKRPATGPATGVSRFGAGTGDKPRSPADSEEETGSGIQPVSGQSFQKSPSRSSKAPSQPFQN